MFPLGPPPVGTKGLAQSVFATGGVVQDVLGYRIHTFTGSGTFTINSGGPVNVDWLFVAGGAGGGYSNATGATAGGGGAGGYKEGTTLMANGSSAVTVGAAGAGGASTFVRGGNGGNSGIASIYTCLGGGGGSYTHFDGASYLSTHAVNGGSGGGVGFYDGSGYLAGTGVAGEGFAGGSAKSGGNGSGGGGAAGVGSLGTGGAGKSSSIFGSFYATGGKTSGPQSFYYGTGGYAGYGSYSFAGSSGQQGIVILRYPYSPSASAGGNDDYTSLLLHLDAGVNDSSGYAVPVTNGGTVTFDATQSKFGGASARFPASSTSTSFLYVPGISAVQSFGTGDFTIDFWVRFNSLANCAMYDGRNAAGDIVSCIYLISSQIGYQTNVVLGTSSVVTTGTWYHVAYSRAGTTGRLFLNGVQQGASATDSTNYVAVFNRPLLGMFYNSTGLLNGWMEEIRISKGIARWTANFTPPTVPYS